MGPNDCRPGLARARAVIVFRPLLVIVAPSRKGWPPRKLQAHRSQLLSAKTGRRSEGFSERPRSDVFLAVQRSAQLWHWSGCFTSSRQNITFRFHPWTGNSKASRQPNTPARARAKGSPPPSYWRGQSIAMCPVLVWPGPGQRHGPERMRWGTERV